MIRRIAPGIRFKLSFLTGIFVTVILVTATIFHYIHQSQILEEGFEKEVEPSLRYISSVVVDMENVKRNLILVEEMKLRIKEKKRDLRQYKKVVYRKKDTLGNRLKGLGRSLGMKMKYDYFRKKVDTYYSVYLPQKEIAGLERIIRSQLKYRDGRPISAGDYKKLQEGAREAAAHQRRLEAKEETSDDYFTTEENPREARLAKMLREFYEYHLQRIEQVGLHGAYVRILSYSLAGKINYDTGGYMRESRMRFSPLLESREYRRDKKSFFERQEESPPGDRKWGQDYHIGGSLFRAEYAPLYQNPATEERLRRIVQEISLHPSRWEAYLKADADICEKMSEIIGKLRLRSQLLREKRIAPGSDGESRDLYKKYWKLLRSRYSAFDRFNPYRDEIKNAEVYYNKEMNGIKAEYEKTAIALKGQQVAGGKAVSGDGKEAVEALKARLKELAQKMAELKNDLKNVRNDIGRSSGISAGDAFKYLREAVLYDYVHLKFREDQGAYKEYLRSGRSRLIEKARWETVRNWIRDGRSETALSSTLPGHKGEKVFPNGILSRSRSEAEEYMWRMDETPLISEFNVFGYDVDEEGLIGLLLNSNTAGYNAVLIDKTEGIRKIARNRKIMLRFSLGVALAAVFLAWVFSGFMVRRVKGVIEQARKAEEGDLSTLFPEKGMDEIEELGVSLNAMMSGLREREEIKGELAAAGEIQKRLLPEKIPALLEGHYAIGTFYRAMQGVGGDYFDFMEAGEEGMFFCIGDVSSHGVGPALVMATIRAQLHGIIRRGERDLIKILLELNDRIYFDTPPHIFITFFGFFSVRCSSGGRR